MSRMSWPDAAARRRKAATSMNTGQTDHDEQTYRDDQPIAAARSARDGPGPIRERPARLVPSSRYRHPGDVIRQIGRASCRERVST